MTVIELKPDPVTPLMRDIEADTNQSIRDLLIARLQDHRSYAGAARSLGVSLETVRVWCRRLDIEVRHPNRQRRAPM